MGDSSHTSSRSVVEEEEISRPTSPAQSSTADEDNLYSFVVRGKWSVLSDGEAAYAHRYFEALFGYELSDSGQLYESGSLKTRPCILHASKYYAKINEKYDPDENGKGRSDEGWLDRGMNDPHYHLTIPTQIILDHVCQTYYSLVSLQHRPVGLDQATSWEPTGAQFDKWADEDVYSRSALAALHLRSKLFQLTHDDPSLAFRHLKSEAKWCRQPGTPLGPNASQGINTNERSDYWSPAWTLSVCNKDNSRPDRQLVQYVDEQYVHVD